MSGKRLKAIYANVKRDHNYPLSEAISLIKNNAKAKFDETVELVVRLNVDPKKAEQNVRGVVSLPHGTGKTYRVAVFARGPKAEEAIKAGADIVGAEDLMERIQQGDMPFERCVATPDMMALVGRVGKILGPKGLMPNPKLGTVTFDVGAAVQAIKGGQVEYRAEKAGIVHVGVGKASFSEQALLENIKVLLDALNKARPSGVKGSYVRGMSLSSTMGPGVAFVTEG